MSPLFAQKRGSQALMQDQAINYHAENHENKNAYLQAKKSKFRVVRVNLRAQLATRRRSAGLRAPESRRKRLLSADNG